MPSFVDNMLFKSKCFLKKQQPIDLIYSMGCVPKGTRFFYLGSIPRSGTWFTSYLFENFYKHIMDGEYKLNESNLFIHYPNLSLAKLQVHSTCPGFYDEFNGKYLQILESLVVDPTFDSDISFANKNSELFFPQKNQNVRIGLLYRNPFDHLVSLYDHMTSHSKILGFK